MGAFDNIKNKVTDMAKEHGDKLEGATDAALDKGADLIDDKTGGKFSDKIQQGRDIVDGKIGEENA